MVAQLRKDDLTHDPAIENQEFRIDGNGYFGRKEGTATGLQNEAYIELKIGNVITLINRQRLTQSNPIEHAPTEISETSTLQGLADRIVSTWGESEQAEKVAVDAAKSAIESAITCGELLLQAKQFCPRGEWEEWRKKNVVHPVTGEVMSDRLAARYQRIAKHVDQVRELLDQGQTSIRAIDQALATPKPKAPHEAEIETKVSDSSLSLNSSQTEEQTEAKLITPAYTPEICKPSISPEEFNREMAESAARRSGMAVHHSSESVEHYTPKEVLDLVIEVLGMIDLDPCADPGRNVPAKQHITKEEDGLTQPWKGRVFVNPPYGREIDAWMIQLAEEYKLGHVTEAITLVPARTDTQWWRRLSQFPVCFWTGRITFVGSSDPAPFPSALFYLGADTQRFYKVFSQVGEIRWPSVPF